MLFKIGLINRLRLENRSSIEQRETKGHFLDSIVYTNGNSGWNLTTFYCSHEAFVFW